MVFEGDLSSVFTETPSSLTDSEGETIRLTNLQVNETLEFVPVPSRDNLTRIVR